MVELIIIPILVGIITQVIKLSIDGIPNNLNWQHLFSDYGGMPSSHTAFVTALVTSLGLKGGLNSPAFAVAVVLLLVVIKDAMGFRREIGRNAAATNVITKEVFKSKRGVGLLNERIGHTPLEVLAGLVTGVVLTLAVYGLFILL